VGREGERMWERGRRKEKGRKAKEEKGRGRNWRENGGGANMAHKCRQ